jgi:hypothetical protein
MPICICRFIHHAISGRETRQSRYKARVDLPESGKRENQDCDLSCDGCFTYGIIHVLKDKRLLRGLISPLGALTGKPAPRFNINQLQTWIQQFSMIIGIWFGTRGSEVQILSPRPMF